jgi:glycosyltransferase involved in cell wall biosynthesis
VFNAETTLEEALTSLCQQTLEQFEIIAVDDGSADNSGAILDAWAQREPRLRCVHVPHGGLVVALNRGLEQCAAPLIARMDADDICHPQRFEKQVDMFDADESLSVVACRVESFPRADVREGFRLYEQWQNRLLDHDDICREIFIESPLAHPSAMFRADEVRELGGYHECQWPEDYDLWLRYYVAGKRFAKHPEALLSWREHPHRLTRTDGRYSIENFLRAKAHYLVQGPLAACDSLFVWGAGRTGRRLSKHLSRGGRTPVAFIDVDAGKIGSTVRHIPVVAATDLQSLWNEHERPFILAAVASRGARELIREELRRQGLKEGEGFLCVA